MKNKKSKIIVPALGLILLSTTASISGSVAWFTANRTAEIKAGTFAVVNTNGNLDYTLSNGRGVSFTDSKSPITTSGTLTDSSLDISSAASNVIVPDASRHYVDKIVSLSTLGTGTNNVRGDNILSAYAWDISFTLSFPTGGAQDVGLFFDATNSKALVTHEVGDGTEESDGNWYTNEALSEGKVNDGENLSNDKMYYRATPRTEYVNSNTPGSTAYGFRMAFIPTNGITGSSEGYGKVWSPFRANNAGGCTYVEGGVAQQALPNGSSYTTKTVKATNGAVAAFSGLTTGKGLIDPNASQKAIPANNAVTSTNALSNYENYLGFFDAPANAGSVTMKFTCVAWFEGTDISINPDTTVFEKIKTTLVFGVSDLASGS